MQPRSTIRDVARAAGVSIATVSRVFEGTRRVNPELADRVRIAASELGYAPNPMARGLRVNTSSTLGMVVPEIANPFYASLVEAVVRESQQSGRELLLADSLDDPTTEAMRVDGLLARRVDGLIIVPCDHRLSDVAVRRAADAVPTVQLDRTVKRVAVDSVACDDRIGIEALIEHLGTRVDSTLHLVSATPTSSTGRRRLDAFRKAVSQRVPRTNEHLGTFDASWGRQQTLRIIDSGVEVRTVVCGADIIALGALRALQERGLAVPGDVIVTGFDDISFAALANPPITTIRQPVELLAAACVELLDRRAADPTAVVSRIRIQPQLMIRASSAG
jgi:LacI family transcriptional regulator